MEGVGHRGNRLPWPDHPTLVHHQWKVFVFAGSAVKAFHYGTTLTSLSAEAATKNLWLSPRT